MRKLTFPHEAYSEVFINEKQVKLAKANGIELDPHYALVCQNEDKVGLLEMLFSMISKGTEVKMDKKKHKTNKRLRNKLKEISRFKDNDEDQRVLKDGGPHDVILEDAEWDLLKEHLDSATPKISPTLSGTLEALLDLVDAAEEYKPTPA